MKKENPFEGYNIGGTDDRKVILEYFEQLMMSLDETHHTLPLLEIYKAFSQCIPDFTMSMDEMKKHLDDMVEAKGNNIGKNSKGYYWV